MSSASYQSRNASVLDISPAQLLAEEFATDSVLDDIRSGKCPSHEAKVLETSDPDVYRTTYCHNPANRPGVTLWGCSVDTDIQTGKPDPAGNQCEIETTDQEDGTRKIEERRLRVWREGNIRERIEDDTGNVMTKAVHTPFGMFDVERDGSVSTALQETVYSNILPHGWEGSVYEGKNRGGGSFCNEDSGVVLTYSREPGGEDGEFEVTASLDKCSNPWHRTRGSEECNDPLSREFTDCRYFPNTHLYSNSSATAQDLVEFGLPIKSAV